MPNKHAAIKALRKNRLQAVANGRIKKNVKALFAKGAALVKAGNKTEAAAAARVFQKAIDKAAKRNVLSTNAASRKKASLMKLINAK